VGGELLLDAGSTERGEERTLSEIEKGGMGGGGEATAMRTRKTPRCCKQWFYTCERTERTIRRPGNTEGPNEG